MINFNKMSDSPFTRERGSDCQELASAGESTEGLARSNNLGAYLDSAWDISRAHHGNRLTVHVPGMFMMNGNLGKYQAVSITGDRCDLSCEHCKGSLLKTMPQAPTPDGLLRFGRAAAKRGDYGFLVTGGCDRDGRLPWRDFIPVIKQLKAETGLIITVHAGQVGPDDAAALKNAGVDQALVDLIGDDTTAQEVYHLAEGTRTIRRTMESLATAGLEIVPHVIFGIHYGRERGEHVALEMLKAYPLRKYVVVVLMSAKGTPMERVEPPALETVAAFIARARHELPTLQASLGCARPRGRYRRRLDVLAFRAGINALALPSDELLEEAKARETEVVHRQTCCSLG